MKKLDMVHREFDIRVTVYDWVSDMTIGKIKAHDISKGRIWRSLSH